MEIFPISTGEFTGFQPSTVFANLKSALLNKTCQQISAPWCLFDLPHHIDTG